MGKVIKKWKRKYVLGNGHIYWHKLYYDLVPDFLCNHSLPLVSSYNLAYYLYQPWKILDEYYRLLKWSWQRVRYGISERDMWGYMTHHAEQMIRVCSYLRKYKHGHPMGMTPAIWDRKLDQMQAGFQAYMDEENDVTSYKKLSREAYRKLRMQRHRKLMFALKLFREHYYSLWD